MLVRVFTCDYHSCAAGMTRGRIAVSSNISLPLGLRMSWAFHPVLQKVPPTDSRSTPEHVAAESDPDQPTVGPAPSEANIPRLGEKTSSAGK